MRVTCVIVPIILHQENNNPSARTCGFQSKEAAKFPYFLKHLYQLFVYLLTHFLLNFRSYGYNAL